MQFPYFLERETPFPQFLCSVMGTQINVLELLLFATKDAQCLQPAASWGYQSAPNSVREPPDSAGWGGELRALRQISYSAGEGDAPFPFFTPATPSASRSSAPSAPRT